MYKKTLIITTLALALFSSGCFSQNNDNPRHLSQSIDYSNQASRILNRDGSPITSEEIGEVMSLKKKALGEAKLVDLDKLNKHYNDFGDNWRDKYIKGLELFLEANEDGNVEKSLQGQMLLDEWDTWYQNNFDEIRKK